MVKVKGSFGLAYWLPFRQRNNAHQVILWDVFGMVKWSFQRLSDLPTRESTDHHESPGSGHFKDAFFCCEWAKCPAMLVQEGKSGRMMVMGEGNKSWFDQIFCSRGLRVHRILSPYDQIRIQTHFSFGFTNLYSALAIAKCLITPKSTTRKGAVYFLLISSHLFRWVGRLRQLLLWSKYLWVTQAAG